MLRQFGLQLCRQVRCCDIKLTVSRYVHTVAATRLAQGSNSRAPDVSTSDPDLEPRQTCATKLEYCCSRAVKAKETYDLCAACNAIPSVRPTRGLQAQACAGAEALPALASTTVAPSVLQQQARPALDSLIRVHGTAAASRSASAAAAASSSSAAATGSPASPQKPDLDAYPRDSTKYPCAPGAIKIKRKSGWRSVPNVPKFLGLSGLIPFFALSPPLLLALGDSLNAIEALQPVANVLLNDLYPSSAMLQIGYGTAIVSFLGAVHWGSAMQSRTGTTTKLMFERYIWSVTPALVVFPAAAWGPQTGSVVVLSALLATFAIDAKFNWKGALPKWYMALRTPLALGSTLAMLITVWHAQQTDRLNTPAATFR